MTLIVLLNALFGVSIPISKVLLESVSPLLLTAIRMGIGGLILILYEKWWHNRSLGIEKKHLWILAQIIVLGIFGSYALRYYALQYLPAGKTSFLLNFSPIIASIYAYIMFNERMTRRQWIGLLLGFFGMIPMLMTSSKEEAFLSEFAFISLPELILIFSAALYTYAMILVQKLVRDYQCSPAVINGITMGLGGILSLMVSCTTENITFSKFDSQFYLLLFFLIFTSNIVCHTLQVVLLKKYSATFLSFSGFLSPLFSVFYGWSFLHETVTWHFYLSALVVIGGLYLFYQDEKASVKQVFVESF
jgi:drug/metabolite transporter (DMT)-like permease